jgi:N-acetylglucosamine-6-phosphate deacetylase
METNSGEITAKHYATGQPVCLRWRDGQITDLSPTNSAAATDGWLGPALIDLQVNGYAGVDFQQDNLTTEDLLKAARGLQRDAAESPAAAQTVAGWFG